MTYLPPKRVPEREALPRLHHGFLFMSAVEIALGTAFATAFWPHLKPGGTAIWITALWTTIALRLIAVKRERPQATFPDWRPSPILLANMLGSAVLWTATCLLLADGASVLAQVSAPLASGAIAFAACGFLTMGLTAVGFYVLPNIAGLAAVAALIDEPICSQAAILSLLFPAIGLAVRLWNGKLIAESISLRDQLLHAKHLAETASAVKSSIIAHMSHELRTPLNAIIGFSEIMDKQILGPVGNTKYVEYAKNIYNSASHLLEIINDILDLSRIESGKSEFNEKETDLAGIVEFAARMVRETANKAGVIIEIQVAPDTPAIVADERMVKQMVLNLLSNAIKFTPMGGHVVLSAGLNVAGEVCIAVRDNGIGIAAEDLQRVFEPFVQVEGPFNRRHQGTGLGLALVRAMAEQHHARLEFESELGQGTTARVCFPSARIIPTYAVQRGMARTA